MAKKQQQPRVNKTKEQLAEELKQKAETSRKRARAKNELWPFMLKNCPNIEDGKMFVTVVTTAIKQGFNRKMNDTKLSELGLADMVAVKDGVNARYKEIMDMFGDETVASALSIMEGMPGAIDSFVKEELTERGLDTLKVDFLD